jgi:mRNA interferase MazF
MGDTTGIIPKRGDVFLVNFDRAIGSEIQKTRPALILQNDIANRYSPVTIVAAITSFTGDTLYPSEVRIDAPAGGLDRTSIVLLNQLRTVDIQRLARKLGMFDGDIMEKVDAALLISLGLAE